MTEQTDAIATALEQLEEDVRELSPRWLERWERAWNSHDLDLLGTLVTEDIVFRDPALFAQRIESRSEFVDFIETLFRAFPNVQFSDTGSYYFSPQGDGVALPWRMTGTFTGELESWNRDPDLRTTTAPNGKAFDLQGVDLYRFRDGLLCDYSIVYDLLDFSVQVGLFG